MSKIDSMIGDLYSIKPENLGETQYLNQWISLVQNVARGYIDGIMTEQRVEMWITKIRQEILLTLGN